MTISRRAVTSALAFPLLSSCQRDLATSENASAFPSKDITYIIPASAGGGFDVLSRFISEAMRRALPHRVNIVPLNVASGGGGKGVNQLFRARPDGYTIGILNIPGIFVLQHIRAVPYNFSDFAWIGTVTKGRRGYVIAVREQSDIRTYDDLLALSRQRPVTFAATGPEGTAHAVTKIATRLLGIRARMVTGYKSSNDYIVGVMRGDTDAIIAAMGAVERLPGVLRVIATFSTAEDERIPGVPNGTDLGHPELGNLVGMPTMAAAARHAQPIVDILNRALAAAGKDPRVRTSAQRNDSIVYVNPPDVTAKLVQSSRAVLDYLNEEH